MSGAEAERNIFFGGRLRDALQRSQLRRKRTLRRLGALALLPVLLSQSFWLGHKPGVYAWLTGTGAALICIAILGRTWCLLYISGHKKRALVTVGPYSVVRNPMYTFSVLGALGVGAQFGSIVFAATFAMIALLMLSRIVRDEEHFLAGQFPTEFPVYAQRVHRFLPRPFAWQDADKMLVSPRLVMRTFLETSLFLLAIPAADALIALQRRGFLDVWFVVP
jgi:protein-S-isoprenylcysteine O-methyltransferase Ste14